MDNIKIQFEDLDGGFYPVAQKPLNKQFIATHNAGNSSYQVGGGGINGAFYDQFRKFNILDKVNNYMTKFSPQDTHNNINLLVPLTNFLENPEIASVMIYSSGPMMSGQDTFSNKNQRIIYNIYVDAVKQIIKYNQDAKDKISCIRITLVSARIFAPISQDEEYKEDLVLIALKALFDTMLSGENKYLNTILIQKDDKKTVLKVLKNLTFSKGKINSLVFKTADKYLIPHIGIKDIIYEYKSESDYDYDSNPDYGSDYGSDHGSKYNSYSEDYL